MMIFSRIGGWARSRWKVAALVAIFAVVWVVAMFLATERSRRTVRRIQALNGLASGAYKVQLPFLGLRFDFGALEQVYLLGPRTDDDGLAVLDDLPDLKVLTLTNTRVSDAGLARLSRFRHLNCVYYGNIDHTKIIGPAGERLKTMPLGGGKGLAALKVLPALEVVQLYGPGTSDADIEGLAQLKQLRLLDLMNTSVTAEGVAKLKKELPGCSVRYR